ncbi:hypothetical protein H5410_021046 [Solanum commersonii]|uniref:Uncharacterized protein n=1 Tax=Solanum commersonii TaxID=4109 RepID=A0A9J5ZBK6_SOLCO|nr:hypothetical protein H5410_021046 [Solanum commersonii]
MLLQITYQDKVAQTKKENTIEDILKAITTLCTKVDSMDNEIQKLKSKAISQSHDYKHAEICQSEDTKHPELEGDVGILQKTHNDCFNVAAGTSKAVRKQYTSTNLNKMFEKPFTPKIPKDPLIISPQTSISTTTKEPTQDYLTQKLQGYNKLIAQPKTKANLVKTCYNYGLLSTVYTYDGEELSGIPEIHRAFITYKRVTKGNLFYLKFYAAPAEILYDEIKPIIQVVKIGLTRDMIIP